MSETIQRTEKILRVDISMSGLLGFFEGFSRDERGAAAAEYALLLAIIASGMAVAAGTLGSAISNAMENASNCIAEGPDCNP
jgi:pilus assembly protein Flp/PilA